MLPAPAERSTKDSLWQHQELLPGCAVIVVDDPCKGSSEHLAPKVPEASRHMAKGRRASCVDLGKGRQGSAGSRSVASMARGCRRSGAWAATRVHAHALGDTEAALSTTLPAMQVEPGGWDFSMEGAGHMCIDMTVHCSDVEPSGRLGWIMARAGGDRTEDPCTSNRRGGTLIYVHRLSTPR